MCKRGSLVIPTSAHIMVAPPLSATMVTSIHYMCVCLSIRLISCPRPPSQTSSAEWCDLWPCMWSVYLLSSSAGCITDKTHILPHKTYNREEESDTQQGAYWSVLLSVYYLTLSVSVRLNTHTHCRKACFSREVRMQITLRKTADYSTKTERCLGMSVLQNSKGSFWIVFALVNSGRNHFFLLSSQIYVRGIKLHFNQMLQFYYRNVSGSVN